MRGNFCRQGRGHFIRKKWGSSIFGVLTILCGLAACQVSFAAVTGEFRTDQILIQPRRTASALSLARFHTAQQAELVKSFPKFGGVQVLRVPKNQTVAGLIAKYRASGLVEFAEPDYL